MERDGVRSAIPSVDSVAYYGKAIADRATLDDAEAVDETESILSDLKSAVFDEGKPVQALRRQFEQVIRPKSEEELADQQRQKTRRACTSFLRQLDWIAEDYPGEVNEARDAVEAVLALLRDVKPDENAA